MHSNQLLIGKTYGQGDRLVVLDRVSTGLRKTREIERERNNERKLRL